ncbi:leukotoxin LktA family filamentous adhesin [uncultured Hydrogenophaga sp.]|uniref:leukotoxin LktA family filamentous adhesin n=1 Tax=uncultured Hydrogenophaga sp. TaxID=199683 RepID=UPI00265F85F5|nr:leukotoxin LktA family filamentous adhesin [uncultured Hydrogenophaga sp.]
MTQAAIGYLRRQYLCVLKRCALRNALMSVGSLGAVLAGASVAAQPIVTDGRTQTTVQVQGTVTDISTTTVHGNAAFNSFQRFNVDAGQTVNMHLPGQTSHLLNLVHGERSYINGLVSSYQNGQIGGHVYFLNPQGVIVGRQGVLQVGSLTITTPTTDFMNRLISPLGVIDPAATAQVLAGQVPLSSSGLVRVQGRILATQAATLAGSQVDIAAGAQVLAGGAARVAFGQLVNLDQVGMATEVSQEGGVIRLLASGDINVAGRVSADGAGSQAHGGDVLVMADQKSTLQAGALVSANAGSSGDGGFVEFSARREVELAGGSLQASATQGTAGQVLIDPENITVSADLLRSAGGNTSGGGISWDAGSLTLQADQRLNVASGVVISTRQVQGTTRDDHINGASVDASGNLILKAPHIELGDGAMLLAHGDNTHAGGDISLLATDINALGAVRSASTSITATNATLKGRTVTLRANADTSALATLLALQPGTTLADAQAYLNSELDDLGDGPGGEYLAIKTDAAAHVVLRGTQVQATGNVTIDALAGARAGFEKQAEASVTVDDHVAGDGTRVASQITGNDIQIQATSDTSLKYNVLGTAVRLLDQSWLPAEDNPVLQKVNDQLFDYSSVPLVSLSGSNATVHIGGASRIEAGGALDLSASAQSTAAPSFSSPLLFAAAWGESNAASRLVVDGASLLRAGQAARLSATTDVELDVTAKVNSTNKPIDAVFARGLSRIETTVDLGQGTTTDAASLEVTALTQADIQVQADASNTGASGLGFAVAVNESTSTTTASLGGQVTTASGDVVVRASTDVDQNNTSANAATLGDTSTIGARIANFKAGIQRNVTGAVLGSLTKLSPSQSSAITNFLFPGIKDGRFNASGAVAWADSDNVAQASVAAGASVRSGNALTVGASVSEVPKASATAKSTSNGTALGGSAVVARFGNQADAWVGANAQTDARGATLVEATTLIPYPWQINWNSPVTVLSHLQGNLLDLALTGYTFNSAKGKEGVGIAAGVALLGFENNASAWVAEGAQINQRTNSTATPGLDLSQQSVDVRARNEVNLVTAAGIASTSFLGSTGGKGAIGGVASIVDVGGKASATVHDGALVRAAKSVTVDAQSQYQLASVAESGGSSDSLTIQGAVGLTTVNTQTVATIDDKARIQADDNITVSADGELRTIAIAGGVAATKGPVGIGMSVAVNTIDNQVSAFVGNANAATDTAPATGTISAGGNLAVRATADTEIGAYSLAGALATNSSEQTTAPSDAGTTQSGAGSAAGGAGAGQGKFGIAMSGDASVNTIQADTVARLGDGVQVSQADNLTIAADNQLAINALSGAVTISTQPQGNSLAGSYAQNTLGGTTAARLTDSSVNLAGDLNVQAGVDGSIRSLTASLAGAKGKAGVAGSVSINEIEHQTQVLLANTRISGADQVGLFSADRSTIQSVAGALAFGGKAGVGLSFAWNRIGNSTTTRVDTSAIDASGAVTVQAESDNTIDSVAASIGASKGPMAGAGAVSINTVTSQTAATVDGRTGNGIDAGGAVDVTATDTSRIAALAGGVGATSGQAGFGAAVGWSEVNNAVAAQVTGAARLRSRSGSVAVNAASDTGVQALAAAGGAADKVAVAGSFAAVQTGNQTLAQVDGGSVLQAAGEVRVAARDAAEIESLAGSVALSGQAALGVAAAYNRIGNATEARVAQASLNGGSVAIEARTSADIANAAVGGGGAAKAAVTGSLGVNTIDNRTAATATDADLDATGAAAIVAQDDSRIQSISGAAAVGGNAAVGAAGAYNHIGGTVLAQMSGGTLDAASARVSGQRTGDLEVWAISGAGSASAGFAGSIALNEVGGSNVARVADGAVINASGNAVVSAESDDIIRSRAGAAGLSGGVGGAGAVAFNDMQASTLAQVSGTGTRITASGLGSTVAVDNGRLAGTGSLADRQQQDSLRGVAVIASSTAELENFAISAAGGGSATVAATVSVALLGGSTTAELSQGATLNDQPGQSTQQARVGAFHHDEITSGTGGGAIGGDAGVGGAVDSVVVSHTTTARVNDAAVRAQQAVAVQARSTTGITQAAVAVGGGSYAGLAGTGALVLLDGTTQALVDDSQLTSRGNALVEATADTEVDIVAGALAASGVAGVGVTAAVTVSQQQTTARVGGDSNINAAGTTRIGADSTFAQTNHAYTAAAAGGVGVAGTVSVVVLKGSTDAQVSGTANLNDDGAYTSASQDVAVAASDRSTVENRVGSLGVGLGGVGVGAVADVVLVNNGASATVGGNTRIRAGRDIGVVASTVRDIDSLTTAAAGGSTAGIAGAASVIAVGARPDGDASDNTSGSVDRAGQMVRGSATGNQLAADHGDAGDSAQRADAARAGVALNSDFAAPAAPTSAAATVASSTVLTAGRDVNVSASNQTTTQAIAVGAAVSGGVSLGGGVAIAQVDDRTLASLTGSTSAQRNVRVQAQDTQGSTSTLRTYAGGAGLAGLAASYAWHDKSSQAQAELGGTVSASGNVTVDASLQTDLVANGGAAAVGAIGVGAAIALVDQNGQAQATLLDNTRVTSTGLDVQSQTRTRGTADVVAASGGLLAGAAGALADAGDHTRSLASIGNDTLISTGSGALNLRADADPQARAQALGVAVSGGVSIGASVAHADVGSTARASTGDNADITADRMDVRARTLASGDTAVASATAGAGGLLLGASATDARATVNAVTEASLGQGNTIYADQELALRALSTTSARADATGINGGLLAGGSNTALARNGTVTRVQVGDAADLVAGSLRLQAEGNSTLRAGTVSGAGGLGVLLASRAETDADGVTQVLLGTATGNGGTVVADSVDIDAVQRVDFDATADSTSAAAVGASGARAVNQVDSTALAAIGRDMTVAATTLFSARAGNDITKSSAGATGYQVDSGSGGVLNAAAARSSTTIRNDAQVTVGQGALINVDNPATQLVRNSSGKDVATAINGLLELGASNNVNAYDRVRLDSGGAIAVARSESSIDNTSTAQVSVGDDAALMGDGNIELSALTAATVQTRANSKTYGAAGAAQGDTRSTITADQAVTVGTGALIEAEESVYLMAGADRTRTNQLVADAETRLWNRTAVPIETDPNALGRLVQHNDITLAAGSQVNAVRDVNLTATEGEHRARGYGEGTDLYREVLSAIGEFFGADTSSLKITGGTSQDNAGLPGVAGLSSTVRIDGGVRAGLWNHQYITIGADSSITSSEALQGVAQLSNENVSQLLQDEIRQILDAAERKNRQYNDFKGGSSAAAAIEAQASATLQRDNAVAGLASATQVNTSVQAFVNTARDAGTSTVIAAAAATSAAQLAADQAESTAQETTAAVKVAATASATAATTVAASATAASTAAAQAEANASDLRQAANATSEADAKAYLGTMADAAENAASKARALANAMSAEAAVLADSASTQDARSAAQATTVQARAAADTAARSAAGVAATDADTTARQAVNRADAQLAAAVTQLAAANSALADAQDASGSSDAALGMLADVNILTQQQAQLSNATSVDFVKIGSKDDIITARSGNVRVTGKALTGSGAVVAPGDARIEIVNNSTRFMKVDANLFIPDEVGGLVSFNGMRVSGSADINQRNAAGQVASLNITDAASTDKPSIRIENNATGNSGNSGGPAQLWVYGDITNLGGEVNATSEGTLRVAASIGAETVNLVTGGDFIKTFTPGFSHQGGDPTSRLSDVAAAAEATKADASRDVLPGCSEIACGSTIAGNNVYISAEKLNINGLIQAGLPDRQIVIPADLTAAIAAAPRDPSDARYLILQNPVVDGRADTNGIKLRYDTQLNRLELADVRMGGGHMELFGNMFSTGNGELRVMDGYGRINIVNNSSLPLAVGRLDTGPGVQGTIRITDTARDANGNQRGAGNTPLVTEITRLNGVAITRTNTGSNGDMVEVGRSQADSGRTTWFDPMADRRFNWINSDITDKERIQRYETKTTWGSDFLGRDPGRQPNITLPDRVTRENRVSGDWLSIDTTPGLKNYEMDYSISTSPEVKTDLGTTSRKTDCFLGVCHSRIYTSSEKYSWTVYESYHHSVNASQRVAVKFIGYDSSNVSVDTNGQLLIGGLVRSVAGGLSLDATQGIAALNPDARVLGQQVTLSSTAGAIGSAAAPVRVELVNGGSLTASGRDGVSVATARGDLVINSVSSTQGDVNLSAEGSIRSTTAGTSITGNNVNLVSLNGGIHGLMDNLALQVETLGTNSVLSAAAVGNIRLQEATGDMRVRQVASAAGDVFLTTPGQLVDANTVERTDEQTRNQLLALWTEMGLTGPSAQAALERNLQSQKVLLQQQYENYFRMRNLKRQDDGSFTADAYNASFRFQLTQVQAAALLSVNDGWGAAELAAYEAQQTTAYHAAQARFGAGGYVANFLPTLTAAETAALSEGAVWTEAQLANGLAGGLFRPTSDTDIRLEQANVVGRQVTLTAQDGIGTRQASPRVITLDANGLLSDSDKLALLAAERSDIVVDGNGQIRITEFEDVDVTASGLLNASTTRGSLLLGSEADLTLGQVSAPEQVRIKTGASLLGAAGLTHVTAGSAVLEAGLGRIGTATEQVQVDLAPTGTLTARAGTDLFVREVAGDMVVGTVFARGDANLQAQGSIVESVPDSQLDVRGTSVTLVAGDTVGRPGGQNALDVQVRNPGRLNASAPTGIYLSMSGLSGTLGDITTQGRFELAAVDSSVTLAGRVQADAGLLIQASDDIRFDGGTARTDGIAALNAGTDGTGNITRNGGAGPDVQAGTEARLNAPDAIGTQQALQVVSGGPLSLQGRLMNVGLRPLVQGAGAVVNITGQGGTTAQDVRLDVQGAGDLRLATFVVGNARVTTDAPTLSVPAGFLGDAATFVTPFFTTRMDRQDRAPAPGGTTIRGFTLDGDFFLSLTPTEAYLGDYVVNYDLRRLVFGTPLGSAELTVGAGLLGTSASPDREDFAIDHTPAAQRPALINIDIDALEEKL